MTPGRILRATFLLVSACVSNDFTIAPPPRAAKAPEATGQDLSGSNGRLPTHTRPIAYAIDLVVDPTSESISGTTKIDVALSRKTDRVSLHARGLRIRSTRVQIGRESFSASVSDGVNEDEIVVALPGPVSGRIELTFEHEASFQEDLTGAFRLNVDSRWYAATQFEPMDARRVFPSFDEPSWKTPFTVSIRTPKTNLAFSNGREERTTEDGDARVFHFATTRPLPTYLVAFAVGPFDVVEGTPGLRVIAPRGRTKGAEAALATARSSLTFFEEYLKEPYPFEKLDLVSLPDFSAGAMENAGLAIFRDDLLLLPETNPSIDRRRNVALTIAHEVAHQWFGNLVTPAWWDDLWLNEAFATWAERKAVQSFAPELLTPLGSVRAQSRAMELDALSSVKAIRRKVETRDDAEGAFDEIVYEKGARVVGMLERWVGPESFREGVTRHLRAHVDGSATATDFFRALGEASGKDVASVAAGFVDRTGVPLVRISLSCDRTPSLTLAQTQFGAGSTSEAPWTIPFCIGLPGGRDGASSTCFVLGDRERTLGLPSAGCPPYIIGNVGEETYARWYVDPVVNAGLVKAWTGLPLPSRFALLDNTRAAMLSGQGGAKELLDLLEVARKERDPDFSELVLETLTLLGRMPKSPEAERAFRKLHEGIVKDHVRAAGFSPRRGESEAARLYRARATAALARLSMPPDAVTTKIGLDALDAPGRADWDVAAAALSLVTAARGDDKLFIRMESMLFANPAPSPAQRDALLAALASFTDPALLARALNLSLDTRFMKADIVRYVRHFANRPRSRGALVTFLTENAPTIVSRWVDFAIVGAFSVLESCDPTEIEKLTTAWGPRLDKLEGGKQIFEELSSLTFQCSKAAERERDNIARWLAEHR